MTVGLTKENVVSVVDEPMEKLLGMPLATPVKVVDELFMTVEVLKVKLAAVEEGIVVAVTRVEMLRDACRQEQALETHDTGY